MAPRATWSRVAVGLAFASLAASAEAAAAPKAFFEGARVSSFLCRAPVRCLEADPAVPGAVWVGTDGGYLLHATAAGAVTVFGPAEGVPSRSIRRVAATSTALAVLGEDGSVAVKDGDGPGFVRAAMGPAEDVAAADGELWAMVASGPVPLRRPFTAPGEGRRSSPAGARRGAGALRFASGAGRLLAYGAEAGAELAGGLWSPVTALSQQGLCQAVVTTEGAVLLHGSGEVSLEQVGGWRRASVSAPGDVAAWRLLAAQGRAWIAFGEGLLRVPGLDGGGWRCFVGRPGLPAPRGVSCAAGRGGHGWFGTVDGALWEHLAEDDAWRFLDSRQGVPAGAVRALAEAGGALWVGGDGGLARLAPGATYLEAVRLPGGPPGPFGAAAALASGDLVVGDGRWLHRLTAAGAWVPRVVEAPARWLVPGEGDVVWCVDSLAAVAWGVNPARRVDGVPLSGAPLVALAAEAGLLFPAARGAVARVDLRSRRIQPDFWTAPPPFRVARGRWLTTVLSAVAADGKGIVGGTRDGVVARLAGFNPSLELGNLGAFTSPRRAVLSLAVRGASLYAGLAGEGPPLWELTPAGAWRALPWPAAAGGPPSCLAPFGGGLAALAPSGVVLVDPAAGRVDCIDGGRAAGVRGAAAVAVSGRRLWVAGSGVASVELLAGSVAR